MLDFCRENIDVAKEWVQKLFFDKKFCPSMIFCADKDMTDAIIKHEKDPFAFYTLDEEQFGYVFSQFKDDNILVATDFTVYLNDEQFFDEQSKAEKNIASNIGIIPRQPIAFTISKNIFTYNTYLGIVNQFSYIAFVDQKSGLAMLALPELNFLIQP